MKSIKVPQTEHFLQLYQYFFAYAKPNTKEAFIFSIIYSSNLKRVRDECEIVRWRIEDSIFLLHYEKC